MIRLKIELENIESSLIGAYFTDMRTEEEGTLERQHVHIGSGYQMRR